MKTYRKISEASALFMIADYQLSKHKYKENYYDKLARLVLISDGAVWYKLL